jgi:hypothetical protein
MSPRSARELKKKSSKDSETKDKDDKKEKEKTSAPTTNPSSTSAAVDSNHVGGGVRGASELVTELLKTEQQPAEPDVAPVISYEPQKGTCVRVNGEWKGETAGGCMDNSTWRNNPQIFFTVTYVRLSKTMRE